MYTIYAGDELLWQDMVDDPVMGLLDPVIKKGVNKAGSLEFSILPSHPLYDRLTPFQTLITVDNGGEDPFFEGRVVERETDFYRQRKIVCEGSLAYLNDSYAAPATQEETPEQHFRGLLEQHNAQCDASGETYKRFEVGTVTVTDSLDTVEFKSESYRNVKSAIDSDLVDKYKAYLRVRRVDGKRYLDLLKDLDGENTQAITFGQNLLDLTDNNADDDAFSVIVPIGQDNLTVAEANNGSIEIKIDNLYQRYGRIPKIVSFNDISDAGELMTKAQEYIENEVNAERPKELSITALDFAALGYDADTFEVGMYVNIVSDPNDVDERLILKEMEIHLSSPDESTYEFGDPHAESESRGGISSAAATITKSTYSNNDYLKDYIKVNDAALDILFGQIGIHLRKRSADDKVDRLVIENGKVELSNTTGLDVLFKTLRINGDDERGTLGKYEDLAGTIHASAEGFEALFENTIHNMKNEDGSVPNVRDAMTKLSTLVFANAEGLSSKVSRGDVSSIVTQTFNTFTVDAEHIDLNGLVRTISADIQDIVTDVIEGGTAVFDSIFADYFGGYGEAEFETITCGDMSSDSINGVPTNNYALYSHIHSISISDEGVLTLGTATATEDGGGTTFNLADTKWFKDAMFGVTVVSAEVVAETNSAVRISYETSAGRTGTIIAKR